MEKEHKEKSMTSMTIMTLLLLKHYLADYVFNPAYEPAEKHIYGSIGSLAHLGMHMLWCFALLIGFLPLGTVAIVTLFDCFVHYHEDYIKTKYLHKRKGLSDKFRRCITGMDQLIHMLTYVAIVYFVS